MYAVDCMLILESLPMRDAREEWSIFSMTSRISLFWNEEEVPHSIKTKYITIWSKRIIYFIKYYGFNVISVSRGQSWYLISSHHGTSQCWVWYSWILVNTCAAVTFDVLTQLMDLQHILLACYVRYSKIIQVQQLKNQKWRYGQLNDFRRLIKLLIWFFNTGLCGKNKLHVSKG